MNSAGTHSHSSPWPRSQPGSRAAVLPHPTLGGAGLREGEQRGAWSAARGRAWEGGRKGRERAYVRATGQLPRKVGCGECRVKHRKFQNAEGLGLTLSLMTT